MLKVNINRKYSHRTILVPECWNDLDSGQLIAVARILFTERRPLHRSTALVRVLCRLAWYELGRMETTVIQEQLLPLCGWIEQGCDLTTNLLPVLKLRKSTFYGPEDHLKNLRFAEFDFAERALADWQQAPEHTRNLFRFVATLYRPARSGYDVFTNPEGDTREPFNQNLTAAYAALLEKELPVDYGWAVALWYLGCRAYIIQRHPRLFPAREQVVGEGSSAGYYGLMRAIAKEGIYGTFEQVEQLYLYNALHELECALDEKEAMDAHIESLQNKNI